MGTGKLEKETSVVEDPQALVGRTIRDRYRVEALLGMGGMGAVYKVMHTGIERPMALKVLSAKMTKNPSIVARFEREAKATANFGHPHVAAATDYGRTEDGQFYLVMEYIAGKELREVMDESDGALPPVRALFIARQIASALSRAHKLGIVHRDLKPENIMLIQHEGQADFVKVLDFGLALISRHLNSDEAEEQRATTVPKITQVGEIFGTPSYMAPEQTVSATTDIRTDLYAVGILLYEMLTGLRPFVGRNPVLIIQQQLATPPPPMRERAPTVQVPADIEAMVMRLLEKQPSQRFQTPDELIRAIDRLGAVHQLAWPGSSSSSNPAVAASAAPAGRGMSRLTLRLSTMRTGLSGTIERLRSGSPARRWLAVAGVVVVLALLAVLWRLGRPPAVAPPPESAPPEPTQLNLQPAPSKESPAAAPGRRGGSRRHQSAEHRP